MNNRSQNVYLLLNGCHRFLPTMYGSVEYISHFLIRQPMRYIYVYKKKAKYGIINSVSFTVMKLIV